MHTKYCQTKWWKQFLKWGQAGIQTRYCKWKGRKEGDWEQSGTGRAIRRKIWIEFITQRANYCNSGKPGWAAKHYAPIWGHQSAVKVQKYKIVETK